jgi:hypothetical protein
MGILRAKVCNKGGWWEAFLIDLAVAADGATEAEMIEQIKHALVGEYVLALRNGETPFVKLIRSVPKEVAQSWADDSKTLRSLNLPQEVKQALSAVFQWTRIADFSIETPTANNGEAVAA